MTLARDNLARDKQKAFVVESMTSARLESADVKTFGKLTANEEVAPLRIAGEQVLKGPLRFKIEACTPDKAQHPGEVIPNSCTGEGTIEPTSSARGELGLPLLRIGDTGTCQGNCIVEQHSSKTPSKVVCRVRIADSGQNATPPSERAKKAGGSSRRKKNQALMLRIAFRAFIHRDLTLYGTESGNERCWAFEPFPFGHITIAEEKNWGGVEYEIQFRGDCRDFGEAQFGSDEVKSRVEHEIELDANDIGALAASNVVIRPRIGKSHQRIRSRLVGRDRSEWTEWREREATASDRGKLSVPRGDEIEIVGQASYPFSRLAPSIDYRVWFTFARLDGKQVRINYQGRHDWFPDYELVVNDKVVWKYVTSDLGPSPLNLVESSPFSGEVLVDFGASGNTRVYATPAVPSQQVLAAAQLRLAADIVQFALDIVGIVDPTGTADALNGLISLGRGKWLDAAISGISMVPYIGDLAKTAKLPRYVKSVKEAIALASIDHKFAKMLKPALKKVKEALDKVPLGSLPELAQNQIRQVKSDIEVFTRRRMYNPNPKHELGGFRGVKGSRLDLTPDEAYKLLNDATRCLEVPGKKQLVAVKDRKIYVFQPDGVGAFHAYPSTGNEITSKYPTVAKQIAAMLGVTVNKLSRMD